MENKRKKIGMLIAIIAIVVAIAGTYAAFYTSNRQNEDVSTSALDIAIVQENDKAHTVDAITADSQTPAGFDYTGTAGETINEKVSVQNVDAKDCYVRLAINRSWMKDGAKYFDGVSPTDIQLKTNEGDWIVINDPDETEVVYCYYRHRLVAGTTSAEAMDSFIVLPDSNNKNTNVYSGLSTHLEFKADAIQTTAAADAMLGEWGVKASFDDAGNLTTIEEQ